MTKEYNKRNEKKNQLWLYMHYIKFIKYNILINFKFKIYYLVFLKNDMSSTNMAKTRLFFIYNNFYLMFFTFLYM